MAAELHPFVNVGAKTRPEGLRSAVPAKTDRRKQRDDLIRAIKEKPQLRCGYQPLSEGYVEREFAVQVDVRVRSRDGDGSAKDFVAIFERSVGEQLVFLDRIHVTSGLNIETWLGLLGMRNRRDALKDDPMFIFVGEVAESGEWVEAWGVPSLVRLYEFDPSTQRHIDTAKLPVPSVETAILDGRLLSEDREGVAPTGFLPARPGELARQMIKGGANVLDVVPSDETQFGRRVSGLDVDVVARSLSIYLGGEFMRVVFDKGSDCLVERAKMFCRPI